MVQKTIKELIDKAVESLSLEKVDFVVEHPESFLHGEYSTNVAMVIAKSTKANPLEVAEKIAVVLQQAQGNLLKQVEKIEVAKPGFINFFLENSFFESELRKILEQGEEYGKSDSLKGQKIIVEYTNQNPFKEFHIGHLMPNSIGEAIARLAAFNGAEVKRAAYQSDIGLHVAKAIAYKIYKQVVWNSAEEVARSYVSGGALYEDDLDFKELVTKTNKLVYEKTDENINSAYEEGRRLTLDKFEEVYKKLGSKFDFYFFESTTGEFGKVIVHKHMDVFEESDGAIVFHGENFDPQLHTRVFMNKAGLPTYEAKDLGLAKLKYDVYPYDASIIVTANEQSEYFKVILRAMHEIFPELSEKTKHVSHGMLRLPTGKMSSRTGDVITAEVLISELKVKALKKIEESDRGIEDKERLSEEIAVGAIKYSILKQSPGKDIIFDLDKSLSFEGDSGPYLQYTFARCISLLEKAKEAGITSQFEAEFPSEVYEVERYIYRFPEIVERAQIEMSPSYLVTYIVELAAMFNKFYAENKIIDIADKKSSKRVAITEAVSQILQNSLILLGISAPRKM
jgi:arginyl-tRNA synthetase